MNNLLFFCYGDWDRLAFLGDLDLLLDRFLFLWDSELLFEDMIILN